MKENKKVNVVLTGFGNKKIQVIKEVMKLTNWGLPKSKKFVEDVPSQFMNIPIEDAMDMKKIIEKAGGVVNFQDSDTSVISEGREEKEQKQMTPEIIDRIDQELDAIWASLDLMGLAAQQPNRENIKIQVAIQSEDLGHRVTELKDFIHKRLDV